MNPDAAAVAAFVEPLLAGNPSPAEIVTAALGLFMRGFECGIAALADLRQATSPTGRVYSQTDGAKRQRKHEAKKRAAAAAAAATSEASGWASESVRSDAKPDASDAVSDALTASESNETAEETNDAGTFVGVSAAVRSVISDAVSPTPPLLDSEQSSENPPNPRGGEVIDLDSDFSALREVYGRRPLRDDGTNDDPDPSAKATLRRVLAGRGGRKPAAPVPLDVLLAAARRQREAQPVAKYRPGLRRWLAEGLFKTVPTSRPLPQIPGLAVGPAASSQSSAPASPPSMVLTSDPVLGPALERLAAALPDNGPAVVACWFRDVRLESIDDGVVRISTASRHVKSTIYTTYAESLARAWGAGIRRVLIEVRPREMAAA